MFLASRYLTLITTLCCFLPLFIILNHAVQMKRLNTLTYRMTARVICSDLSLSAAALALSLWWIRLWASDLHVSKLCSSLCLCVCVCVCVCVLPVEKWYKRHLTYQIVNWPRHLSLGSVRLAVRAAFQLWSNVSGLVFQESPEGPADIRLAFYEGDHNDGASNAFDGPGEGQAHDD